MGACHFITSIWVAVKQNWVNYSRLSGNKLLFQLPLYVWNPQINKLTKEREVHWYKVDCLECMCLATGHFKWKATVRKGASSAFWMWKLLKGERWSLSWTSCQEGMVCVEQRHSECTKSQRFRVVSWMVQKVRKTVWKVFYTKPHHPGLITESLLVLSFQAGVGPSVLNDRSEPLTFGMLQVLFVALPSNWTGGRRMTIWHFTLIYIPFFYPQHPL